MARASAPSIESSRIPRNAALRIYAAATSLYLFVAPFPSSAGSRAFLLFLALAALGHERWRAGAFHVAPPRAVLVTGLAWLAWCAATLLWSERPAYSLEELQRELGYGSLAFLAFFAGTVEARDVQRAAKALLAGALLLGLFEWIAQLAPSLPLAERYRAADGSFSTQLVLVAPLLAFVAAARPSGMGARPSVVAAIGLGLVAAGLATENRMLWIALLAQALGAFAACRPIGGISFMGPPYRAAALALAVIALALAASWIHKAYRYYPQASGAMQALEFDQRPAIWAASMAPLRESPWLGHGFGREIVGDRIERAVPSGDRDLHFRHAHNMFIDMALETGLAGVALFAGLLLALLRAFLDAGRRPGGAPIALAGVAMTAGFVVKSLTDDFFFRPSSLVFWALSGMLLGLSARLGRRA